MKAVKINSGISGVAARRIFGSKTIRIWRSAASARLETKRRGGRRGGGEAKQRIKRGKQSCGAQKSV